MSTLPQLPAIGLNWTGTVPELYTSIDATAVTVRKSSQSYSVMFCRTPSTNIAGVQGPAAPRIESCRAMRVEPRRTGNITTVTPAVRRAASIHVRAPAFSMSAFV